MGGSATFVQLHGSGRLRGRGSWPRSEQDSRLDMSSRRRCADGRRGWDAPLWGRSRTESAARRCGQGTPDSSGTGLATQRAGPPQPHRGTARGRAPPPASAHWCAGAPPADRAWSAADRHDPGCICCWMCSGCLRAAVLAAAPALSDPEWEAGSDGADPAGGGDGTAGPVDGATAAGHPSGPGPAS
jgi:hypothetical protein